MINFDLPRSVEGYAIRAAAAVPPITRHSPQVNGVIVSFVQAAGGDVEMLRSTECAYRFKVSFLSSGFSHCADAILVGRDTIGLS